MTFLPFLLPIVIVLTWARLIRPGLNSLEGQVLLETRLPLLARVRMHVLPASSALILAVFLVIDQALPVWSLAFPIVSTILLVAVPVKYTLTDQGIRLGYSQFRRWTEFGGVRRAPGGARLLGMQRRAGMQIWLSGSRGDDEFLQFLRQTVKGAYKGTATVIPFPASWNAPQENRDEPFLQRTADG